MNDRRPHTNRVEYLSWGGTDNSPFEIVAWRITVYVEFGQRITIDGVLCAAIGSPIVVGGAFDALGRPIDTLFRGNVTSVSTCLVVVEYRDPDIAS